LFELGYQGFVSSHLAKVVFRVFRGLVNSLYSVHSSDLPTGDGDKTSSRKRSNGL
jgi:hypothetical protein